MNIEDFTTKGGDLYTIEIDMSGEEITVYRDCIQKGCISLHLIEGDFPRIPDTYHITNLALNECKGQGIGRRCLQFHAELFDSPITAGPNDGSRPDDGRYLIDDGLGFVAKMRSEGIVCSDNFGSMGYDSYEE